MAVDRDVIELVTSLREVVEEVGKTQHLILQKQDVYDKRLKEIDDNMYNQSPRTHYSSPDVSYGTAGKDQDREDMKGENTKPADVSTVKKGKLSKDARNVLSKNRLTKHDVAFDGIEEKDEEDVDMYDEDDVLEDDDDMEKGYRMGLGDDELEDDVDLKDVDMGRDDEIRELREMLKQAMMMMKSQNSLVKAQNDTNTLLMQKLEEIAKSQKSKDEVPLVSQMLVRKSVDDNFTTPIRQLGGHFETIMQDRDGVIKELVKGAVTKRGDINEGAFKRLNQMRQDLGDLPEFDLPVYDTGIVGM